MENPKVSIIIPVFNVEKYLQRCIDSIIAQTFTDFECILIDDVSPDNCPVICDKYAQKDKRIKVIHNSENKGASLSRKTGFDASSGEYIQFVDSDDWIEPDMTEKLYTTAKKTDADIVTCDYIRNNDKSYNYEIQTIDTEDNFNNLGFVHICTVWNKFYHRRIIAQVFFPVASRYEDRVITQQAIFFSKKIIKLPIPLYHYFNNNESTFRGNNVDSFFDWRNNILYVIDFLSKNLKDEFKHKEKNINEYVNRFKFKVLKRRLIFKNKSLFFFYPESKFYRWLLIYLFKRILNKITPYGLLILFNKEK